MQIGRILIYVMLASVTSSVAVAQTPQMKRVSLAIVPMINSLDSIYLNAFQAKGVEVVDTAALLNNLRTSVGFNKWYQSLQRRLIEEKPPMNGTFVGFNDCAIETVRELSLHADFFTLLGGCWERTMTAANGRVVNITWSQRMMMIDLKDGSVRCLCDEKVRIRVKKNESPNDHPDGMIYRRLAAKLRLCADLAPL